MEGARDTLPREETTKIDEADMDRNYKMDNLPLGVEPMLSCNELKMETEMVWCKSVYSVTAPGLGKILSISGNLNFEVKDLNDSTIATFNISQKWLQRSTMMVTLWNEPPILITTRGNFKLSICLYEYEDGCDGTGEPKIRLKRASMLGTELHILANDHIIGSVKQHQPSLGDFTITFPQDLDVRYKVGLLAACAYKRYLSQRKSSS